MHKPDGGIVLQHADLAGQIFGAHAIVLVEEADVLPSRQGQDAIPVPWNAKALIIFKEGNSRVIDGPDDLYGRIHRLIVHHDNLEIGHTLAQDAPDGVGDKSPPIPRRDANGQSRDGHIITLLPATVSDRGSLERPRLFGAS